MYLGVMMRVCIVGPGRVGGALALALMSKGYEISSVVAKDVDSGRIAVARLGLTSKTKILTWPVVDIEDVDTVLITVPDQDIRQTSDRLAEHLHGVTTVIHTSGSLSSAELDRLRDQYISVASLHPLLSISDPLIGAGAFADAYFCIEGDQNAVDVSERVVKDLNGRSFTIPTELKPLYHASAIMSAGHVVALFDMAVQTLTQCGVENARDVMLPLLVSTTKNLQDQTPENALTGSFVRGDVAAVHKHIELLRENMPPSVIETYLILGERSLEIVKRQERLSRSLLEELEDMINIAKQAS